MKTPKFWNNKNWLSTLLMPIGTLYAAATAYRMKNNVPQTTVKPVICIGNLTAGGTGKTPVAISIAKILQSCGYNPNFISRGYGGTLRGAIVDNKVHTAQQVGDEPLLLSKQAPVSINSDRFDAAQKAVENGADIIIMDDGYQNPGLKKDISFLVFDGVFGVGNARPIPAGPLRENFNKGLKRADAAIILGEDKTNLEEKLKKITVFKGKTEAIKPDIKNENIIAFAGIGRPQKLYNSLKEAGFNILKTFDFPDHHYYSKKELQDMIEAAKNLKADIYTTSKDMVKIPVKMRKEFKVLEIEIKWEDEDSIKEFIINRISCYPL